MTEVVRLGKADEVRLRSKIRSCDTRPHVWCLAPRCSKYVKIGRSVTCSQECNTRMIEHLAYLAIGVENDETPVDTRGFRFARAVARAAQEYGATGPGEGSRGSRGAEDVPERASKLRGSAKPRRCRVTVRAVS